MKPFFFCQKETFSKPPKCQNQKDLKKKTHPSILLSLTSTRHAIDWHLKSTYKQFVATHYCSLLFPSGCRPRTNRHRHHSPSCSESPSERRETLWAGTPCGWRAVPCGHLCTTPGPGRGSPRLRTWGWRGHFWARSRWRGVQWCEEVARVGSHLWVEKKS